MSNVIVLDMLDLVLTDGSGTLLSLSEQPRDIAAGDTFRQPFRVRNQDGLPADIAGKALIWALKRAGSSGAPIFSREDTTIDRGTDIDGNPTGFFDFAVEDTIHLRNPKIYRFGVRLQNSETSHLMLASNFTIRETAGQNGDLVTPLSPASALGAGPPGKTEVRALFSTNVALTGIPAAQDGVTLVATNGVLLNGQTDPIENGTYIVSAAAWVRTSDYPIGKHVSTQLVGIKEGTLHGGRLFSCVTKAPNDVAGTDPLSFTQIGAGGSRAPAIGQQGAVDVEDPAGILGARRRLTYDDIDAAFTGSLSGSFAAARALNSPLVDPQFTFTANAALSAVAGDVTVTDDTDTQNIIPPTSPFGYGAPGALPARSYNSSTRNASKSWDLKLTKLGGSPVIHRFASVQFQAPVYFGKSASLGPYNAAFIAGLSSGAVLAAAPQRDITTTTGVGEFVFYCYPAADGGTPSDFIDVATGFPFGVSKVASAVSVDNGFGVMVPIDVWRSDFPNLGTTTMRRL